MKYYASIARTYSELKTYYIIERTDRLESIPNSDLTLIWISSWPPIATNYHIEERDEEKPHSRTVKRRNLFNTLEEAMCYLIKEAFNSER